MMVGQLCLRRVALTVALGAASLTTVDAQAEESERSGKRMVVTVEDNATVDAETAAQAERAAQAESPPPPRKKGKKAASERPPEVDAPEVEIDAYLRRLSKELREAQADLRAARREDDADEVMRLDNEVRDRKELLADERDRLTTTQPGLVAGGAVLTVLGGVSLVASLALLIGWPISGVEGEINDTYGWASLGCLIGGTVGLSAGIPMISAGARRVPRGEGGEVPIEDAWFSPPTAPRVGLTFSAAF
jgi:hypothetical protein